MTTADSGTAHGDFGLVAAHYSQRVPYLPEFFRLAAQTVALPRDGVVLDLACGTGELASGIAPYCRSVLALDKSPEMLSARRDTPENVRFMQADIEGGAVAVPERADLVMIGRAVHLLDREKLLAFLDATAKTPADVLVCSAGLTKTNPWFAAFGAAMRRYGWSSLARETIMGFKSFQGTQWLPGKEIVVEGRMKLSVDGLLRHALTYSSTFKAISNDKDNFARELERILAPYFRGADHVDAGIITWGVQFHRAPGG